MKYIKKLGNTWASMFLSGVVIIVVISTIVVAGTRIISRNNSINLRLNLAGEWNFDGNGNDTSGNSNHGTVNGSTYIKDRFGNDSSAIKFNGTGSDYVHVPHDPSLNPTGDTFSISLWYRADASGSSNGSILYNKETVYEASAGGGYTTYAWQPHWSWDGGTSTPFTVGQWHHLVIVYDGTMQYMYLDGELTYSRSQTGNMSGNSNRLAFATRGTSGGGNSPFNGAMDDIKIYDRDLNVAEVNALYNAQSESSTIAVGNTQKGLTGWWDFNGDLKDKTPYANNGTVTSGTATLIADRTGDAQTALDFVNGTDVNVGSGSELASSDELTIAMWVKLDSYGTYYAQHLIKRTLGTSNANYVLYLFGDYNSNGQEGIIRLYGTTGGSWSSMSGSTRLNTGQWYHVAIGYNSTQGGQLYIDGSPVGGRISSGALSTPATDTIMSHGDGALDDVRFYNTELSSSEIATLYESNQPEIAVSELSRGLVADWDFNGDAKDKTPYSNHGSVSGATLTVDRMGVADTAYSFGGYGTSNDIVISATDKLKPTDEITISAWFYWDGDTTGYRPIVEGAGNLNNQTGTYLGFHNGGNSFRWRVGDGTSYVSSLTSLSSGQWYHTVGVYSAASGINKLYIDGQEVDSDPHSQAAISYDGNPISIGRLCYTASTGHRFDGDIDDVRIYNRALTTPEVERLYETY